jgi:tetratricopeptide (TPR) repeat protein
MVTRILRFAELVLAVGCAALAPGRVSAQGEASGTVGTPVGTAGAAGIVQPIDLDLSITGPNGAPFEGSAVVTISKLNGQVYSQGTATAGHLKLNGVPQAEYSVQVVAAGFGEATKQIDTHVQGTTLVNVIIQLRPSTEEEEDANTDSRVSLLVPKAQQAIGKAFEELGSNMTAEARNHLEMANRIAPNSPEVSYLLGVYSMQTYDRAKAKSYWTKAIELNPQHYRALISLGQALVDENKPVEALPYLERAVQAEPSSWRAHAIYTDAYLREDLPDQAVKHAERALELDRGQAVVIQRYLAAALAMRGEKDKAIGVLQTYVRAHHSDVAAKRQLEKLQSYGTENARGATKTSSQEMVEPWTLDGITALPLPAAWLPPDIDKRMPPVEPGSGCALDEVVKKAGQRVEELVVNVDRFASTESLKHETINKWGLESLPEKRKFDYLVSIKEVKAGLFDVKEFRRVGGALGSFPDGVESNGLPALVLIFHPHNVGSFEMTCEGLARWNGGLAWQVHFRQRDDKPNNLRAYRNGLNGSSYPVAVKGRAWIAADSYQIERIETDLVRPMPEIRLVAEHTIIDYGPVRFHERNVDMWLPQSAEVYCDWRGLRFHRRHSFSKYLLFSVDDKQTISAPKAAAETPPKPSTESDRPNP